MSNESSFESCGVIFNLAALKPSVDEGFKYAVALEEMGKLSYMGWTKTADPDRTNSICKTIENPSYQDGQLNVVLFKTQELAESFVAAAKSEGPEQGVIAELGVMELSTKGLASVTIKEPGAAPQPQTSGLPKFRFPN